LPRLCFDLTISAKKSRFSLFRGAILNLHIKPAAIEKHQLFKKIKFTKTWQ